MREPQPVPGTVQPPAEPPPVQEPAPDVPEEPAVPPAPQPVPAPEPPPPPEQAAVELPASVRWAHGAEYRAAAIQIFHAAGEELQELAGVLEPGAWAVVLDVDETVLSNLGHEVERARAGRGWDRAHWNAWIERRAATPLPGAVAFVEQVRELGGVVALITNRDQAHCPPTEDNLRRQGVPYDVILCRPNGAGGDKAPRWTALREGTAAAGLPPLEIVMAVGDNIRDFPPLDQSLRNAPEADFAPFGESYFVIPNPLYGSFEDIPLD
jgi:5'-nucleotidase (lipoprotein e(P4) family)